MPSEKKSFAEQQATHAPLPSFTPSSEVNRRPRKVIFKWTKMMVVRGREIGTVCRIIQQRETQIDKSFKGVDYIMWARVVMQQQNH